MYAATGWGESKFTVAHMGSTELINDNTRINSVSHTTVNHLLPHPVHVHIYSHSNTREHTCKGGIYPIADYYL